MKNIYYANGNKRKAKVAITISDKTDYKRKTDKKKEGHYITTKMSIRPEDIIVINIYDPNIGRNKGRNRQQYNKIMNFNTSLISKDR